MLSIEATQALNEMSPYQRAKVRSMSVKNIRKKGFGMYEEFYTSDERRFDFWNNAIDHEIELMLFSRFSVLSLKATQALNEMSPYQRAKVRSMSVKNIRKKGFGMYEEFYTSDGRRFDFRDNAIDHEIELMLLGK